MRNSRSLRRPKSRRSQAGMTLIEIIIVIVLIGAVIGLVGNQVFKNKANADWKLTKTQIQTVANSIEQYNSDVGEYPRELNDLIEDPKINGWLGPYGNAAQLKDQFHRDLQYAVPGEDGRSFDLMSYGKDGRPGGSSVDADIRYGVEPTTEK